MVNINDRQKLIKITNDYLLGIINNFQLDDEISTLRKSNDLLVREISKSLWYFYDDMKKHCNKGQYCLTQYSQNIISRWLRLLKTNYELNETKTSRHKSFLGRLKKIWERPGFLTNEFWPFKTEHDWLQIFDQNTSLNQIEPTKEENRH